MTVCYLPRSKTKVDWKDSWRIHCWLSGDPSFHVPLNLFWDRTNPCNLDLAMQINASMVILTLLPWPAPLSSNRSTWILLGWQEAHWYFILQGKFSSKWLLNKLSSSSSDSASIVQSVGHAWSLKGLAYSKQLPLISFWVGQWVIYMPDFPVKIEFLPETFWISIVHHRCRWTFPLSSRNDLEEIVCHCHITSRFSGLGVYRP